MIYITSFFLKRRNCRSKNLYYPREIYWLFKRECIVLKNDEIILPVIPGTHETENFIGLSQVVSKVEILREHNKITTSGRDFKFKYEKFEDIPINNKKYDELLQELNVPRKKWLNKK